MAGELPAPRRLVLRTLRDPDTGEALDRGLVVWMPGPGSFTGEDQAELHIHGGLAVRMGVLRALSQIDRCRPAEPGEFTRRAFLNGRMDLSAVEGLADLIDAETEAQRRQALRQLEGGLGGLIEGWRGRVVEVLALLEAALDFSDEPDVAADIEQQARARIAPLAAEIRQCLADGRRGERLREGFVVVIAGPPNAGKSTLLNALAQRDVAIVSSIPGTTRDALEVRCNVGGLPVTFIDTAGLRDTDDPLEREGIIRTERHVRSADLVLWLIPPETEAPVPAGIGAPLLRVATKADLRSPRTGDVDLVLSARTGSGITALLDCIAGFTETSLGHGDAVITRERHRQALETCYDRLTGSVRQLDLGHVELAAEDLRLAARALGEITGRVDVEEILDRIFLAFCIGK